MQSIVRFWRSTSCASAAEYALILAIVGTALALAAILLGGAIGGSINQTAECIGEAETC